MAKSLKFLAVATAAIGTLVLVTVARTSNNHHDNLAGQSGKSDQSALVLTSSIAPSSITTSPITGSDASISTYGLDSAHPTDW